MSWREERSRSHTRGAPETEKGSRAANGWKELSAVTQIMTRQIRSRAARSPLLNNHTIIKWLVMYPDRNIIFQLALRRGAERREERGVALAFQPFLNMLTLAH